MADPYKKPTPGNATFRVLHAAGRGYYVEAPDGSRASCIMVSKDQAVMRRDAMQALADKAAKRMQRPCLCCGTTFASEGIHNRMCNRCRSAASNDEAAPFSFGAIHGRKRA